MFAPDVIMPGPPGRLHRGLTEVTASLRSNPDNLDGRVTWRPVGAGLSADGEQGFTFGFMTQVRTDGTTLPLKYMVYSGERRVGMAGRGLQAGAPPRRRSDRDRLAPPRATGPRAAGARRGPPADARTRSG